MIQIFTCNFRFGCWVVTGMIWNSMDAYYWVFKEFRRRLVPFLSFLLQTKHFFSSSQTVSSVLDRCSATRFTCIILICLFLNYLFIRQTSQVAAWGSCFFRIGSFQEGSNLSLVTVVILWGMLNLHQGPLSSWGLVVGDIDYSLEN